MVYCERDKQMAHVILCKHGHHRSVAHVELASREIELFFPGIVVKVVHLDHWTHNRWQRIFPDASYGPSLPTDRIWHDWCDLQQNIIFPYHNALANPPPFLLHEDLGRH